MPRAKSACSTAGSKTMRRAYRRVIPRLAPALLVLALAGWAATAGAVVLTGEVRATDAQVIYTPFSNSSPVVIRFFVPEGEHVKKGEPVLRIDPGQAASQLPELDAQIEQAQATAAKTLAELRVAALEAESALVDAQAELETARLDAALPPELVSGLDYDRYQGELDRTTHEAGLKRRQLDAAREAVARQRRDSGRSEEHTSELQSLMRISYAVFCLKKKKTTNS